MDPRSRRLAVFLTFLFIGRSSGQDDQGKPKLDGSFQEIAAFLLCIESWRIPIGQSCSRTTDDYVKEITATLEADPGSLSPKEVLSGLCNFSPKDSECINGKCTCTNPTSEDCSVIKRFESNPNKNCDKEIAAVGYYEKTPRVNGAKKPGIEPKKGLSSGGDGRPGAASAVGSHFRSGRLDALAKTLATLQIWTLSFQYLV